MDSLLNTSALPETTTKHQIPPIPLAKSSETVSESGERRLSRLGTRPLEPEQLPCPRCDSTNTKFCYYNNYNLSQPRHFCKSCRRYWTRGGALRNVPVGGGTRKSTSSNKRPRMVTTSTCSNSLVSCSSDNDMMGKTHESFDPVVSGPVSGLGSGSTVAKSGSSSWWWSSGQIGAGGGFLPVNSYGLGLGPGLGYEHGVLDWPMEQVSGGENGGVVVPEQSPGCSTWQMGRGGEGGVAEGEYFTWPELAISAPAKALK